MTSKYVVKCMNNKCEIKHTCHRFTAISHPVTQGYAIYGDKKDDNGVCIRFFDNAMYLEIERHKRQELAKAEKLIEQQRERLNNAGNALQIRRFNRQQNS